MPAPDRRRVLAIGIDAAEPQALLSLMARGDLPTFRALRARGRWGRAAPSADFGSGAVWPTFITGTPPPRHQIQSFWVWQPALMGVRPMPTERMTPFWASLVERGIRVAVLDVPFVPVTRLSGLVEVDEWGAHDQVRGRLHVWPAALEETVRAVNAVGGPHPFSAPELSPVSPTDPRERAALAAACVSGLRRRADLALRIMADRAPEVMLAVFTEVHRASHYLWHTLDPLEPGPEGAGDGIDLAVIFRELDRQIGRLVEAAGPETTVLLFSLHGMRSSRGTPGILAPLLAHHGLSPVLPWHAQPGSGRLRAALGVARRFVPRSVKRRYHRLAGQDFVTRVAQQTVLPAYDWDRTLAFALPTDQHGCLRVNLAGREARGVVAPSDYGAVCARLEKLVRGLRSEAGEPLVTTVLATSTLCGGAPPDTLPDLIVYWDDAACVPEVRLKEPPLVCPPATELKQSGQHAPDGFFLLSPARGTAIDHADTVALEDLHRLVVAAVDGP